MKFEWNRKLGLPEDPYARRWVLPLPRGYSLRLHNWLSDDDPDAFHDHPTWFITFVLRGGYWDFWWSNDDADSIHKSGIDVMTPGKIRFRSARHRHHVLKVAPNTWTICLFGNEKKKWGFYPVVSPEKRIPRDKFFAEVGHHLPDGGRVRLKPDGSRI